MANEKKRTLFRLQGRRLEIFGRQVMLPASRAGRIAVGVLFTIGGCFAILPVLGVWMIPLGFLILSIDIAIIRRWRRRSQIRWSRWRLERQRLKLQGPGLRPAPILPEATLEGPDGDRMPRAALNEPRERRQGVVRTDVEAV